MEIGIIGLPQSGKTTVFNALTKGKASVAGYSGKPNIGVAKVPDERIDNLAELYQPRKVVPAEVTYTDVPPPPDGFGETRGIGGEYLNDLQNSEALVIVIRAFGDPSIPHIDETIDPFRDGENLLMEMTFSDGTIIHSTFDHPYRVKNKGWCSIKPDMTNDILTNIKDAKQLDVGDICFLMKDGKITEVEFISSKSIPDFQTTYTIKKLKKNNTYFADGVMVGSETLKEKKPNRFLSLIK